MVHSVARYKSLLQSETNKRVRDLLARLIRELESREKATRIDAEVTTITVSVETHKAHGHIFPM